jgi:hypothetical protein
VEGAFSVKGGIGEEGFGSFLGDFLIEFVLWNVVNVSEFIFVQILFLLRSLGFEFLDWR